MQVKQELFFKVRRSLIQSESSMFKESIIAQPETALSQRSCLSWVSSFQMRASASASSSRSQDQIIWNADTKIASPSAIPKHPAQIKWFGRLTQKLLQNSKSSESKGNGHWHPTPCGPSHAANHQAAASRSPCWTNGGPRIFRPELKKENMQVCLATVWCMHVRRWMLQVDKVYLMRDL